MSLQVACHELLPGDSELSSVRHCEPNRPPGGAILTVVGGDPFVDMQCETTIVVHYYRCEMRYRINRSMVEYMAGSSDLRRNEGLLYPIVLTRSVVSHYTCDT
jgi:hypothetical protein